jgi:hypothetical protein
MRSVNLSRTLELYSPLIPLFAVRRWCDYSHKIRGSDRAEKIPIPHRSLRHAVRLCRLDATAKSEFRLFRRQRPISTFISLPERPSSLAQLSWTGSCFMGHRETEASIRRCLVS